MLQPYCGEAPGPAALLARWNLDPWLLGVFAVAIAAYAVWARRSRPGATERLCFAGGTAVLLIAFVSPICAWSSALFSVRVIHHLLVIGLAAPLLAWSFRGAAPMNLGLATAVQTAVIWLWHAPGPYAWALSHPAAYWVMELSLLGAALAFWSALRRRVGEPVRALTALSASMIQMGLLGALLTFAPRPLFEAHDGATYAWGLTPLEDQQLAGVVMWAPGALPYFAAALAIVAVMLGPEPRSRTPA